MSLAAPAPLPSVTQSRKAAMVVQMLLREGSDLQLSDLPESAQMRLTRELGALNVVDKATLNAVAAEFERELSNVGMTAPGSVEAALKSLEGRISPATAARLREEAANRAGSDPWALVVALDTDDLLPVTRAESAEVSAVLLSKMPTAKAADLLGKMSGDAARRVAYAMSKTTKIRPDAIARIGVGLARQYCGAALPAFTDTAEARIGAILNSSASAIRDRILEDLISQDAGFGAGVRKAIFTFEDIPARLAKTDVPKVLRDIDPTDLLRALSSASAGGGALEAAAEYLLGNMSTRLADSLREEMGELGRVKQSDGEAAQTAVTTAIRAAADAGTIALTVTDEEEDEA